MTEYIYIYIYIYIFGAVRALHYQLVDPLIYVYIFPLVAGFGRGTRVLVPVSKEQAKETSKMDTDKAYGEAADVRESNSR